MSKNFYEFYCPVKIIAGLSAVDHLPFEVSLLDGKRPMIITDKIIKNNGLVDLIENAFKAADSTIVAVYDDVPPDSSLNTVKAAAKMYRDNNCDALIAVGGGSVIDTAKGVNILVSVGGDDLLKYSGANTLKKRLKPFFVVPTTAGTGSEVTAVAVVADTENNVKLAFTSQFVMPDGAVLDPRMTFTMPPSVTSMTGMDAMTHAIESYTGIGSNPMSDSYAVAAIRMIRKNIFKAVQTPTDADARLNMLQGATMAGIAFSNSMVGLVHSLGHATGAVAHLPHGMMMSLFLPYVLEYNLDRVGDRIGELLLPLAGADVYAATPKAERPIKAIATVRAIRDELFKLTKLPRTLQETNKVTKAQFEEIAKKALDDGSILYNPKEATIEDLKKILNRAWDNS